MRGNPWLQMQRMHEMQENARLKAIHDQQAQYELYQRMQMEQAQKQQEQYARMMEMQNLMVDAPAGSVSMNTHAQEKLIHDKQLGRLGKQYQNLQKKQFELQSGVPSSAFELPRLTKSVAEMFITNIIGVQPNMLNFIKLQEPIVKMRHACMQGGVTITEPHTYYYGTTKVMFGLCQNCGVVHYHYDVDAV